MLSPSLLSVYRSEQFKMQRNTGVYLILIFPFLLTLCIGCYMLYRHSHAIGNPDVTYGYNPWKYVLARYIFQFYSLLYPILTSILCFSVCDVEFKNHGYKLIFLLPVDRKTIFLCKMIFIVQTLLLSIGIAFLMFMLTGYAFNALLPGYRFSDYDIKAITLVYFVRLFAGLLTVTMIQLTLSLATRNFVLPTAFACLGSFCALIMQRWDYIDFVPYNAGWRAFNDFAADLTSVFTKIEYINLTYLVIFLLSSFLIFNRSRG
jgi:hypothetical protein